MSNQQLHDGHRLRSVLPPHHKCNVRLPAVHAHVQHGDEAMLGMRRPRRRGHTLLLRHAPLPGHGHSLRDTTAAVAAAPAEAAPAAEPRPAAVAAAARATTAADAAHHYSAAAQPGGRHHRVV